MEQETVWTPAPLSNKIGNIRVKTRRQVGRQTGKIAKLSDSSEGCVSDDSDLHHSKNTQEVSYSATMFKTFPQETKNVKGVFNIEHYFLTSKVLYFSQVSRRK